MRLVCGAAAWRRLPWNSFTALPRGGPTDRALARSPPASAWTSNDQTQCNSHHSIPKARVLLDEMGVYLRFARDRIEDTAYRLPVSAARLGTTAGVYSTSSMVP